MARRDGVGYRLVPAEVPKRQRTSFYQEIIDDFRRSNEKSVLVEADKRAVTLVQGLRKTLDAEGITEISVVQRGADTYLVRK